MMRLGYAWRRMWLRSAERTARAQGPQGLSEGSYRLDETTEIPMGEVVTFGPRAAKASGAARAG
jgi:hypothetical protein